MSPEPVGWDHPDTARAYRRFGERAPRYREANRRLVAHARLTPGLRVLDVGAGDGGTARAALPYLGADGSVVCVEPAAAMRDSGLRSLRDPRVTWSDEWPRSPGRFDRVSCGAAIWQVLPLPDTFRRAHALLRPGGCLCFDIPAAYLGEPDLPGGGRDPLLLELMAVLARDGADSRTPPVSSADPECAWARPDGRVPDAPYVEAALRDAGFGEVEAWSFSVGVGQDDYREWLKIPPTTDRLLRGMSPAERARRIDRAWTRVDPTSWKWERWRGWTAWVPA